MTMAWVAAGTAVVGLVGGAMNASAAKDAAQTQANAANQASQNTLTATQQTNAMQQGFFNQGQQNQAPFLQGGQLANAALLGGMGLNPYGSYAQPGPQNPNGQQIPGTTGTGPTMTFGGNPMMQAGGGGGFNEAGGPTMQALNGTSNAGGGAIQTGTFTNNQGQTVDAQGNPVQIGNGTTNYGATAGQLAGAANSQIGANGQGNFTQTFGSGDLGLDPSYQFRLSQGMQALKAAGAATGSLQTGQGLKNISDYAQGSASQEYQNAYNRFMQNQNTQYGRLAGLAGLGQNAAAGMGNQGVQTGANIANTTMAGTAASNQYLTGAAQANASGQIGMTNAITGGINNAINSGTNTWMAQQFLNSKYPNTVTPTNTAATNSQQDQGRVNAAQNAIELDPTTNQPIVDAATGVIKINPAKFQYGLYKAGLGSEALKAGADQIANVLTQQKTTGGAVDLNNDVRNHLATAAQAAYDQTSGTDAQKTAAAQQVWETLAAKAVDGSKRQGQIPLDPTQFTYQPGLEHTLYRAQITPGAQESLKVSQGQLSLGWAGNKLATDQFGNSMKLSFTDAAAQDPRTPASARARDIVFNTTGERLPDGMPASEIYNNPKYKELLSSAGNNAGAALITAKNTLNAHTSFADTLNKAKGDLAAQGLTPANFIQNWVNKNVTVTPALTALYAQMQQMPTGLTTAQTWESMKAVNDALTTQAAGQVKNAGGGGGNAVPLSGGVPANTAPVRKGQATSAMATPAVIDMINKTGHHIRVPADKEAEAKVDGYTRTGQ